MGLKFAGRYSAKVSQHSQIRPWNSYSDNKLICESRFLYFLCCISDHSVFLDSLFLSFRRQSVQLSDCWLFARGNLALWANEYKSTYNTVCQVVYSELLTARNSAPILTDLSNGLMPRLISYSTAAATRRLVPTGDKFAFRRREIKFPRSNPPGRRIVTQENLHSVNKSVNISNSRRTKKRPLTSSAVKKSPLRHKFVLLHQLCSLAHEERGGSLCCIHTR